MPPKHFLTSPEDFDLFIRSVRYWCAFFGLKSYELHFRHDDKHQGTVATLEAESGARNAVFTLKKNWPYPTNSDEIQKCAFHEVCELMLHELREAVDDRKHIRDTDDLVHTVIRQLENSVFRANLG